MVKLKTDANTVHTFPMLVTDFMFLMLKRPNAYLTFLAKLEDIRIQTAEHSSSQFR